MHAFNTISAIRRMLRVALFIGIGVMIWNTWLSLSGPRHSTSPKYRQRVYSAPETVPNASLSIVEIVRELYQPFIPSMIDPTFTTPSGKEVTQKGKTRLTEPLRNKVCILDVDSRILDGAGGLLNDEPLGWNEVNKQTGGLINHYLFAQIHGYDYRFVKATNFEDRHPTWVKVAAIANALHDYDMVVFMDADATWPHLELPLEWLINYWEVSPGTALTMPLDPAGTRNEDETGKTMLNTGFVIAQNTEKTAQIMSDWLNCPNEDDEDFEGCTKFKYDWPHEQGAFSTYIRYKYPEYVKSLPCYEANGYPETYKKTKCMGLLTRHYWFDKEWVPDEVAKIVMQPIAERLHKWLHQNIDDYFVEAIDNKIYNPDSTKSQPANFVAHELGVLDEDGAAEPLHEDDDEDKDDDVEYEEKEDEDEDEEDDDDHASGSKSSKNSTSTG